MTINAFLTRIAVLVAAVGIATGAAAQSTLEKLKKENAVRIGFANEAPWSFAQTDGTVSGVDYDLASLVFGKLGINQVEGVLTKFGSLIPGLKASRFDTIVAGLYIRPARCEAFRNRRTHHRWNARAGSETL